MVSPSWNWNFEKSLLIEPLHPRINLYAKIELLTLSGLSRIVINQYVSHLRILYINIVTDSVGPLFKVTIKYLTNLFVSLCIHNLYLQHNLCNYYYSNGISLFKARYIQTSKLSNCRKRSFYIAVVSVSRTIQNYLEGSAI